MRESIEVKLAIILEVMGFVGILVLVILSTNELVKYNNINNSFLSYLHLYGLVEIFIMFAIFMVIGLLIFCKLIFMEKHIKSLEKN